jgi:tetratricopeptide (TPR) repeat protein
VRHVVCAADRCQERGKTEYLIEDAQKSLDKKQGGNALEYAQDLLKHQPENPTVYELLAEAYDHKNNEDAALDNYEFAIDKYLKKGERDSAARTYLNALQKHPLFILQPATQFVISSQIASTATTKKPPKTGQDSFTFPDAPEGELSLLRAAQMYIDHLTSPNGIAPAEHHVAAISRNAVDAASRNGHAQGAAPVERAARPGRQRSAPYPQALPRRAHNAIETMTCAKPLESDCKP